MSSPPPAERVEPDPGVEGRTWAPLAALLLVAIGFLLGVWLMVVLRSEIPHLTSRGGRLGVFLAVAVGLLAAVTPLYHRTKRGLVAAYGPERGLALLRLAHFIVLVGGVLLVLVAGVFFLAAA